MIYCLLSALLGVIGTIAAFLLVKIETCQCPHCREVKAILEHERTP